MSEPKDGGPAFPIPSEQRYNDPVHGVIKPSDIYGPPPMGLTKREWLAGKALQGLIANDGFTEAPDIVASECFKYADAMLAEAEKKP